MTEASVFPLFDRPRRQQPVPGETRSEPQTDMTFAGVDAVEIVAPDQFSATLLHDYAAPLFPAEIVHDASWAVRFHPPKSGGDWVVELLDLIERWLQSVPLPCAKVLQDGRSYLIRSSANHAQLGLLSAGLND
jgi:hypothetical protein